MEWNEPMMRRVDITGIEIRRDEYIKIKCSDENDIHMDYAPHIYVGYAHFFIGELRQDMFQDKLSERIKAELAELQEKEDTLSREDFFEYLKDKFSENNEATMLEIIKEVKAIKEEVFNF